MYNNIGKKIKTMVSIIVMFSIIGCVAYGGYLIFHESSNTPTRFVGLFFAVIGSFLSWLSGFFLYGFGELIDKTDSIEQKLNRILNQKEEKNDSDRRFHDVLMKKMKEAESETEENEEFYDPRSQSEKENDSTDAN